VKRAIAIVTMLAGAALGQWDATPVLAVMRANAATVGNTNLVGWWKLDGNGLDSSGYGSHGTLMNGPTNAADHNGVAGGALGFVSGSSQYVAIASASALGFTNRPLSLLTWVRSTVAADSYVVLRNHNIGATFEYGLTMSGGTTPKFIIEGATERAAGGACALGTWVHLACIWGADGSTAIYTNAVLSATGTVYTGSMTVRTNNAIGRRSTSADGSTGSGYFTGQIDDVRLYRQALTPAEIATAMSGGQP
jgi:hypothetical protein